MTNKEIKDLIHYAILTHSFDEQIEDAERSLYISQCPIYSWAHGYLWNNKERFTLFEAIIILLTKNTKVGQKRIQYWKDKIAYLTNMRDECELLVWKKVKGD